MNPSLFLLCLFHLATAIVLPTVNDWAQGSLESLYSTLARDKNRFDTAFDGFISLDATDFTWNGARISRDEYKNKFSDLQTIFTRNINVTVLNVVAVADDNGPLWSGGVGQVGFFYNITVTESDSLRLPPTIINYQSSISLHIADNSVAGNNPPLPQSDNAPPPPQSNNAPPPPIPGIRGYFDGRRVVQVNHIVAQTGVTRG